ncbi:hypothetical protein ACKGJI_06550 [Sulfurospirillum sp. 1307]
MEINVENSSAKIVINVKGNIKSLVDGKKLKDAIEDSSLNDDKKPIDIHIKDSFIITSSVIGFLMKFIKKDQIPISLYVYNNELYDMLDNMNLLSVLNIKKA